MWELAHRHKWPIDYQDFERIIRSTDDGHRIFPRNVKILRVESGGNVTFAKRVRHCGIKGKKTLKNQLMMRTRVSEFVQMALEEEGLGRMSVRTQCYYFRSGIV